MRRKLGYCLLTGSLILGALSVIGPTVVGLDTDLTYGSGRDLVYKISKADSTYGGVETSNYIDASDKEAVDLVGEEMEKRLKTMDVEAEVVKEGYDTVRVKLRTAKDDETKYQYLQKYLAFSGGDFTIGASLDEGNDDYKVYDKWHNPFKENSAEIRYISTSKGNVPAVVVPLKDDDDLRGENGQFNTLVKYCKDNTQEANESEGKEAKNCYFVLWANKQVGDTYAKTESSNSAYDPNVASRLIFAEPGTEAWYQAKEETDNYKEFQLIPSSAAITSEGYDSSKADAAYQAAFYYKNLLNATSYKDLGVNGYDVTFAFYDTTNATVEPLVNFGNWAVHPNFGATFIASLIAFAFLAVLLISLYRLGALAILSNVAIALLSSLLMFSFFGAQFGIGALIGLALVALITTFGGMYYFSKFKEQVFQGRSLRKSHEEASKRSLWPTIDAGVIGIILGLCVYGFIPSVVGKLGLVLVLGSFFGTLSNLLLLRLEAYLLANDQDTEKDYGKIYNIDGTKVPNLAKEEKPSYFGAFASKDFGKHSKAIGVVASLIALASIVGLSTFTALNGTPYNYANRYNDTTISYIEYRVSSGSLLTFTTSADLEDKVLKNIYIVNGTEQKPVAYNSVSLENGSVHYTKEEKTLDVHYFTVNWADHYDVTETYEFLLDFSSGKETINSDFNGALTRAVENVVKDGIYVSTNNVVGQASEPSLGVVWLGFGVGMLIATVYMVIRYRLSRGLATGLLAISAGAITMGFFALTRLASTPLVSIGGIVAGLLVLIASLFILEKEKELSRDSREKDKDSLAFRTLCISSANAQAAESVLGFAFISAFGFIWYMGFMPSVWTMVYLGIMVGVVIMAIFTLTLLAPSSILLARAFSRVHISIKPKKKTPTAPTPAGRRRGAEPEEAIFIGIND